MPAIRDVCEKSFALPRYLKKHQDTVHSRRFADCVPGTSSAIEPPDNATNDADPSLSLKKRKKYECTFCGKSFTTSQRLQDHERIHTGERPYKCELCSKDFVQRGHYIRHFNTTHSTDPVRYPCRNCAANFLDRRKLAKHLQIDHDEMQYKCDKCSGQYDRFSEFKNHQS
ncbi:hypothetical protein PFISCL1PPCAC_7227, partial [Pristionchus fissidentatus]